MNSRQGSTIEEAAFAITRWIGSTQSLLAHSALFAAVIIILITRIFPFDAVILIFNTAVSLEAIYLAIFIQMTVNRTTQSLQEVEQDIDEMQKDVGEIQEDVDELQEDVEELAVEESEEQKLPNPTLADIHERLRALLQDVERLETSHN